MLTINQPKIIAQSQVIGEPEIHITGESTNNTRNMIVSYPVFSETGERVDTIVQKYEDGEFNEVYANFFNSDKALVEKVMADQDIKVDTTEMPENLVNVEPPVVVPEPVEEEAPVDNTDDEEIDSVA